jgi:hypothetical protein
MMSMTARPRGPKLAGENVDAHVLVLLQRVGRAEQEDGGEQVPLDFQQPVRTVVENEAHGGIAGADQGHHQHQPECALPTRVADRVDQLRQLEQKGHEKSSSVVRIPGFSDGPG